MSSRFGLYFRLDFNISQKCYNFIFSFGTNEREIIYTSTHVQFLHMTGLSEYQSHTIGGTRRS